jgi:hypothetical protein
MTLGGASWIKSSGLPLVVVVWLTPVVISLIPTPGAKRSRGGIRPWNGKLPSHA